MISFATTLIHLTAAVCVFARPIVQRQSQTPQSAAVVLTNLNDAVLPLANQLLYATSENATQEALTPIINNISAAVTNGITDMHLLVGQPISVIMAPVEGTAILDASEIATLLAAIVVLIFQAASAVLKVVEGELYIVTYNLLYALGQAILDLASAAISLINGLRAPLFVQLEPVLDDIRNLGLSNPLSNLFGNWA